MIDNLYYVTGLNANSVKEAYRHIATQTSSQIDPSINLDATWLMDVLTIVSKQDHPGIGRGIAVPQGRVPHLKEPMHIIATLGRAIDFDAIDHEPVDLIFVVLSPEEDVRGHLSRLAYVSRMLKDDALCDRLRGCDSTEAMQSLLVNEDLPLLKAA